MQTHSNYGSGVLLHPTALPGVGGIGNIGPEAYRFIDDLSDMGQTYWQILPIGPVDKYGSPYSSSSTFAGNEFLISFDLLVEDGLLDSSYLAKIINDDDSMPLSDIPKYKLSILRHVSEFFFNNCSINLKNQFLQFCVDQSYWLDDYARYCSLKELNNNKPWVNWNPDIHTSDINVEHVKIIQFIFHDQWSRLRAYCIRKKIKIIGDMPIYVGHDSADVYSNQELFQLKTSGEMKYKSGCPPCEYQVNGQVWGNPLYEWKEHEKSEFIWWENRFNKLLEMVDLIRLDHFIGYHRYYRIPVNDETAKNGKWIKSPGDKLFSKMTSVIHKGNIISEDLGDVTAGVTKLRDKYKYPGMRVLQFDLENIPNIGNDKNNSVVYTGTHDNDTIMGWFSTLPELDSNPEILTKEKLLNFFKCTSEELNWKVIDYAMSSGSNICIIPIQDILLLDSSSRFNTPGTLSVNNWAWRMDEHLDCDAKSRLMELTKKNNRKI